MAQGRTEVIQDVIFDELCDNKLKDSIPIVRSNSVCCSYRTKYQITAESQNLKRKLQTLYQNVKLPRVYWTDKGNHLTVKDHFMPLKLVNLDTDQHVDNICFSGKRSILIAQPKWGKTVLAWRLMYDWAVESDYMKAIQLAFVLPLHLLKCKILRDLPAAISNYYCFENPKQLKTILKQNPKSLFVLDGLDKLEQEEISHVLEFFRKPKYVDFTVIVISRPEVSETIMEYFDKRITIKGVEINDRTQFISKFISDCDANKVVTSLYSLTRPISDLSNWPICIMSLANQISQSQHLTAYSMWTITDIIKFFINYLCKLNLVEEGLNLRENLDVFNRNDGTVTKFRDMCVQFGSLGIQNILDKKKQFQENALTRQIYNCGLLHRLKDSEFTTHLVSTHSTITEFSAAVYLWNEFHTNDFSFTQENLYLINRIVVQFGKACLVLPFLVGLLKEKAVVLFEQMHPYAHLFSSQEVLLWRMLAEYKSNYDLIKILDFLPVYMHRDFDENLSRFYSSVKHAKLVSAGIENGRVKGVFVKSDLSFSLPEDTVIPELYLDSNFDCSSDPLFALIEIILKCKQKFCKLMSIDSQEVVESKVETILPNLMTCLTEIKAVMVNTKKNCESKLVQLLKTTLQNMKKILSTFSMNNQLKSAIKLIEEILPTLDITSLTDLTKWNCETVVWTWTENVNNNDDFRDQIWSFYTSIKCKQRGFYFSDIKCVNTALSKDTEMSSLHYEVSKHNAYHSEMLCNLLQKSQLQVLSLTLLDKSALQILHDISPYLTSLKSLNLTNNAKNIVDVDLFMDKITFPLPRKAGWHSLVLFDIKLKHRQIGVRVYHLCVRNSEPETVTAVSSIDVSLLQCTADLISKLHTLDSNWAGYESVIELGLMLDKHEITKSSQFWLDLSNFKNLQFLEIAFPGPSIIEVGEIIKCIFTLPITHILFSYIEWDLDLLRKLISSLEKNLSFSINIKIISLLTHSDGQEPGKIEFIRDQVQKLLQLLNKGQFEILQIVCSKSKFWPSFMEKGIIDPALFKTEHGLWGNNQGDPETYKLLHNDFHAMYNKFSITLN